MCVEIYTKEPPSPCRIMYLWYMVILILPPVKEIFHFKWGLIRDVVGCFILPTVWYESLTLFSMCLQILKKTVSKTCLFKRGQHCLALLNFPQKAYEYLFEGLLI